MLRENVVAPWAKKLVSRKAQIAKGVFGFRERERREKVQQCVVSSNSILFKGIFWVRQALYSPLFFILFSLGGRERERGAYSHWYSLLSVFCNVTGVWGFLVEKKLHESRGRWRGKMWREEEVKTAVKCLKFLSSNFKSGPYSFHHCLFLTL